MRNSFTLLILLITSVYPNCCNAALDWSYGSLTNADNVHRTPNAIAYASNGTVFVAGVEEGITGRNLIVTKKFSASGLLLASVTNTYFVPAGTTTDDLVKSVSIDASGNVYVLGAQFGSTARGRDMVVIKYNSSLTFQWKRLIYNTTYPNNSFNDVPAKLLFDNSSNVYVAGTLVNEAVPDQTTIVVRKYNSSGTVIYTGHVGDPAGTWIENAGDMCIDGSTNITVTAVAKNILLGTETIMYARISPSGIMSWQKFNSIPSGTTLSYIPEIECIPTGILYVGASLEREASPSNNYSRHICVKFSSSGNKIWETLTAEINRGANGYLMQLDANENLYSAGDFVAAPGTPFSNYRIYKISSSGTQLWSYISAENSAFMRIALYSTTSLFVASQINSTGPLKLRKINAQTGATVWTEDITVSVPPGYLQAHNSLSAIAVNSSTSEVVVCGKLTGDVALPSSALENRWYIRKYGSTSPRLMADKNTAGSAEMNITVSPNPATNFILIKNLNADQSNRITMISAQGAEVYNAVINTTEAIIPVTGFRKGIYIVTIDVNGIKTKKRILILGS